MDYDDYDQSFASAPVRYALDDHDSDEENEACAQLQKVTVQTNLIIDKKIIEDGKWTLIFGLNGPGSVYLNSVENVKTTAVGTVDRLVSEDRMRDLKSTEELMGASYSLKMRMLEPRPTFSKWITSLSCCSFSLKRFRPKMLLLTQRPSSICSRERWRRWLSWMHSRLQAIQQKLGIRIWYLLYCVFYRLLLLL